MLNFLRERFIQKDLSDNDELAKYVFKEKELRSDGSSRPGNLKPRSGEQLSLFEVTNMEHNNICRHGHRYADNPSKNRVHIGYGKFSHRAFVELELKTIYDNKPPRHVSVIFPDEPERRRELAKALADKYVTESRAGKKKHFSSC